MDREFFERPALQVAPALLGAVLTHRTADGAVAVRLTEVEAYEGQGVDPGSHAHRGPGRRNAVMFGPAGHLYAYFTYGMHTCANVVCRPEPSAAGVLLRAGEIVAGRHLALQRRADAPERDLARGPARLASALGIALAENGADLLADPFELTPGPPLPAAAIASGPRVGVRGPGGDGARYPWRFWIAGERTVSAYRAAAAR